MITPPDIAWTLPGLLVGAVHFQTLRRNTALYAAGSAGAAIALHVARMALTAGALLLAAWHGNWPLLSAMTGFLLARAVLVRPPSLGREH